MASMTVADFLEYVRAFNARDYVKQHSFYTSDVELILPEDRIPILKGSKEIMSHYKSLHEDFEEVLVPIDILVNDTRFFFLMEAHFRAKRDVKNGVSGFDFRAGDLCRVTVWALYEIDGGKMKRIYCNLWKQEFFGDEHTLEDRIRDSQTRAAAGVILE